MIIFPAIDLRQGKCVRLLQGRVNDETIYSDDPIETALRWQSEGAAWLHLVDLDGAMSAASDNRRIAKEIIKTLAIPLQFGGGIRSLLDLDEMLEGGAARVVIGTAAVRNPEFLTSAVKRNPDRIVVGLDARDGRLATHGWNEMETIEALTFAKSIAQRGVQRVVYTDISRDGMLSGPNWRATQDLAQETGLKVIASGGVSSLEDLRVLKPLELCGVEGVIVGKALYEAKFSLGEAIRMAA